MSIQGSLQLSQGQAEQALSTWESATAIYKKLGDKALTARSLLNESQAMLALGMYRRAKVRNKLIHRVTQLFTSQPTVNLAQMPIKRLY